MERTEQLEELRDPSTPGEDWTVAENMNAETLGSKELS
jgi:hypothetical protein